MNHNKIIKNKLTKIGITERTYIEIKSDQIFYICYILKKRIYVNNFLGKQHFGGSYNVVTRSAGSPSVGTSIRRATTTNASHSSHFSRCRTPPSLRKWRGTISNAHTVNFVDITALNSGPTE